MSFSPPPTLLTGKKILLVVTGSISCYKALELLRLYTKAGGSVRVVMSEEAKKFIAPLSFEALSRFSVLHQETESWQNEVNHIGYAQWCDIAVVAPATANTINKFTCGIADTLPTQTLLAVTSKIIIAPSANTAMLQALPTQEHLTTLRNRGILIAPTQTKSLACATVGDGALADPMEIFWLTAQALMASSVYANRSVVISGGGTVEAIDDVRYISNYSSGLMAYNLALAAYLLGCHVTLVTNGVRENLPQALTLISYQSSDELFEALDKALHTCLDTQPLLIMTAAVSDYRPDRIEGKLKKRDLGPQWSLQLSQNRDLLHSLARPHLICVGFKAESDPHQAQANATTMLKEKNLDAVCLNTITSAHSPFGSSQNELTLFSRETIHHFPLQDKGELAQALMPHLLALPARS